MHTVYGYVQECWNNTIMVLILTPIMTQNTTYILKVITSPKYIGKAIQDWKV